MGLRARLALFFIAITVIPLTVAVVVLQVQLSRRTAEVTERELTTAGNAAAAAVASAGARAGDLATLTGLTTDPAIFLDADTAAARQVVRTTLRSAPDSADFLILIDSQERLLASQATTAQFAQGMQISLPPSGELARAIARQEPLPGALVAVREVKGTPENGIRRRLGWVGAGIWTDQQLLDRLPSTGGAAIAGGGLTLASTAAEDGLPLGDLAGPEGGQATATMIGDQRVLAVSRPLADGLSELEDPRLILWQAVRPPMSIGAPLLGLLVPAVLLAAILGWVLASSVVAPVERAVRIADAVAAGDLGQTLEPSGGRELVALAGALNTMSSELRQRLEELGASRDQLRQSLSRLGQTLSSSLDLDRTLSVVVETAIETLGADRGMLWLFTPERDALYVKVGRGVGQSVARLPTGSGAVGHVARVGVALRLPADREDVPFPTEDEPTAAQQLAVPMVGRGRVLGVLTILRDDPERAFTQDDLDTLRSFAAQSSVAMENVMLHREAQRLSVTDPLTGLWNFRYFQLQADRELESAARFERSLSMLIIDLDHFKAVNDRFGHQVGDDVLLEVARRIQAATRVPDVVARYGGEEFVVLLPGTDLDGALATAERIRVAVASSKIAITTAQDIAPMSVTCSIGVAEHPRHGTTVAGLLRSADAAMYQAKSQGRDRVLGAGRAAMTGPTRIVRSNRR